MELLAGSAAKVVLGGASAVGAIHFFCRSALSQRSQMRRVLRQNGTRLRSESCAHRLQSSQFPRAAEVARLTSFLRSPVAGTMVVVGSEGSGTSTVAAAALDAAETRMVLRVDLRESVLMTERGFLEQFVRSTGFYSTHLPLVDIGMLKWSGYNQHEVGTCLRRLVEVLEKEKRVRDRYGSIDVWGDQGALSSAQPPPVIFVDELHKVDFSQTDFDKFLHWVLFVTGNQLAHVLLVARPDAALDLDRRLPAFRAHRRRLVLPFPSEDEVRAFWRSPAGGSLSEEDIAVLTSTFGGQLKDVRMIQRAILRSADPDQGNAWREVHAELLADSKHVVARQFEAHVDEGNRTDLKRDHRIAAYKRGLRYWQMAALLVEQDIVSWQELVSTVFPAAAGSAGAEVQDYVAAGLLTFAPPEKMTTVTNNVRLMAASPRLRAAFALMLEDPRCLAFRGTAESELTKALCQQREEQLIQRRDEQARQARGLADLAGVQPEWCKKLEAVERALDEENQATVTELRKVRAEYDALKWKGRWAPTES